MASLFAAVGLMLFYAPVEPLTGPVQKISYLHVPVAINTFVACVVVFAANIAYIWQRSEVWDDLAAAAAEVGVVFCTVVLLTGMIWAHETWQQWWVWSPLLTFSLGLWILYVVYMLLHGHRGGSGRREMVCAVYGVIAFLDVPLIYLSVKLLPDRHPSEVHLTSAMRQTLIFWFVTVTMVCAGLIFERFRLHRLQRSVTAAGSPGISTVSELKKAHH